MMASTARMCFRCSCCSRGGTTRAGRAGRPSLPAVLRPSAGWEGGRSLVRLDVLGELELRAAAGAERLVQGHDLPAARAPAMRLVALVAVEHRGEEPDEGRD